MHYETNSNATTNAIKNYNQSTVPVITKTYNGRPATATTGNKEPLDLKDKAGLLFVVCILLVLQVLGSLKLLK